MKYASFGLLGSLMLLTNCHSNPANPTADDHAGSNGYLINNESDYLISVALVTTPQLDTKQDVSQMIANQRVGTITQCISDNAEPSHTFTGRILYQEIGSGKVIVYRKNPLNDTGWVKQQ